MKVLALVLLLSGCTLGTPDTPGEQEYFHVACSTTGISYDLAGTGEIYNNYYKITTGDEKWLFPIDNCVIRYHKVQ